MKLYYRITNTTNSPIEVSDKILYFGKFIDITPAQVNANIETLVRRGILKSDPSLGTLNQAVKTNLIPITVIELNQDMTLGIEHSGAKIRFEGDGDCFVTIPDDSKIDFPDGCTIFVENQTEDTIWLYAEYTEDDGDEGDEVTLEVGKTAILTKNQTREWTIKVLGGGSSEGGSGGEGLIQEIVWSMPGTLDYTNKNTEYWFYGSSNQEIDVASDDWESGDKITIHKCGWGDVTLNFLGSFIADEIGADYATFLNKRGSTLSLIHTGGSWLVHQSDRLPPVLSLTSDEEWIWASWNEATILCDLEENSTITLYSSEDFRVGYEATFIKAQSQPVSFVADGSTIIWSASNHRHIKGEYGQVKARVIRKVGGVVTWLLTGDLEAA